VLGQVLNKTRTLFVKERVIVLIQMDENSATLTPFGSLIRVNTPKISSGKSWTAKLRAVLASLFR
jgi:hypothetical protein